MQPGKYGIWLDMILRDPDTWTSRMANYGPLFRLDTDMPPRQCKDGWLLIVSGTHSGPADIEGGMDGTRDLELWLGRGKDGSLSLKWTEYRKIQIIHETRYSSPWGIRLWSSSHLDQWPVAPAQDLTPIRAEELPDGNRPSRRIPKPQITAP